MNFNYFISETVFDFILGAVELVASDGWRLLPHYRFEPATGLWRHAGGTAEPPMSLRDVRFADGGMTWPSHRRTEPESALAGYLDGGAPAARRPAAAGDRARARSSSTRTSRRCAGSRCPPRWPGARRGHDDPNDCSAQNRPKTQPGNTAISDRRDEAEDAGGERRATVRHARAAGAPPGS